MTFAFTIQCAITSLYAGTAPEAVELNGKVGWLCNTRTNISHYFCSISISGHGLASGDVDPIIAILWRRMKYGIGVRLRWGNMRRYDCHNSRWPLDNSITSTQYIHAIQCVAIDGADGSFLVLGFKMVAICSSLKRFTDNPPVRPSCGYTERSRLQILTRQ